jgi:hypothetical protein
MVTKYGDHVWSLSTMIKYNNKDMKSESGKR